MANDDKSTRILGSADIQKTRLVRREPSTPEPSRTAPVTDEPKTRMAFRPHIVRGAVDSQRTWRLPIPPGLVKRGHYIWY